MSSVTAVMPKIYNYGKRILKAAPDAIFGTGSEVAGAAMKSTKGSVFTKAKAGFKAVEGMSANGSFWSRATANLGLLKSMPAKYARAARISGKGIFAQAAAGAKGLFKGLGKNMPFIAAASTLLFELPNIWTATKEQGIGQGVKEAAKTGARLAGGAALAAVGSAICPGIGTIVGWLAGDWLTSKVVGQSYTVQKAEAAQKAQEKTQIQQQTGQIPFQGNYNPYGQYDQYSMTNPMYDQMFGYNDFSNPYANDIMMQQLNFNKLA